MIYLNDWSLSVPKKNETLLFHWPEVLQFLTLARYLKDTYSTGKIEAPKDIYSLSICNLPFAEMQNKESKVLTPDQRNCLLGLFVHYFHIFTDPTDTIFCSNDKELIKKSVMLGVAVKNSGVTISFIFDSNFAVDTISGFIETHPDKIVEIFNCYDLSRINPLLFVSIEECERHDPRKEPMWNQIMMDKYVERIGHMRDRHSQDEREKIQYLKTHASVMAQLNGWQLDETLTKINNWDGHPRMVFRSSKMSYKWQYLSIDFESEDFHFELHRHNGEHIKEINWKGEHTGEGRTDHNLLMRKE